MHSRILSVGLMTFLAAGSARGNGRYPSAQHVVIGPGARSDVIALRTTFGLVVSRDGGASFHLLCEYQMFYPLDVGEILDPPIELTAQGEVMYAFESYVRSTPNECRIDDRRSGGGGLVADLTTDSTGATVWAAEFTRNGPSYVLRTRSDATGFERLGAGLAGTALTTLEAAPSLPSRMYLSGQDDRSLAPRLLRSDDGGESLRVLPVDLGAADEAFVSGVDPTDPDVLYVRTREGLGSGLWRSTNGGARFERIASTRDPMLGFAFSDDGHTIWYGSGAEGLWRSEDRGGSFERVNTLPTNCLRFHGGVLWACSDWYVQPFALGRSRDGGRTFEPMLRFQDLAAPRTCEPSTWPSGICQSRWPSLQRTFLAPPPAPVLDAGAPLDAASDAAFDAVAMDGARTSSGTRGGSGGCSATPSTTLRSVWGLILAASIWGGRRRASRRHVG